MKVGVELEAFVFTDEGPVDVYSWLCQIGSEEIKCQNGTVVKTDAGKHLVEFAFPPLSADEVDVIPEIFHQTLEEVKFPSQWKIIFRGVDPRGLGFYEDEWVPKARYRALWEALKKEVGPKWREVLYMSRLSATHVHLAIDLEDPQVVKILNFFNMPGPLIKYTSLERLNIWQGGWARPERLPYFRRWDSLTEMLSFWSRIPRLLRNNTGKLIPDLETLPQPGDPVAESTIWWWARPRWSLGTIEVRLADSMPPEVIPKYVKEVIHYVETLLS